MYSIFTFSQNKMETRNKQKKGARSVFTSVLPDDTKRSLLNGNVLVMSLMVTLDSAMAPTTHTHTAFSVKHGARPFMCGRENRFKHNRRKK